MGDKPEKDIRLSVESALQASEDRFRQIIDASPMGVHFYSLDAHGHLIFQGGNRAADTILGIDHQGLVGKTIEEAFPGLVGTEVTDRYKQVCARGDNWVAEQIHYEDDEIAGAFQVHAFQTQPGQMAAMFHDITMRKRAEALTAERESLYRSLFEGNISAMLLIDPESGEILDANPVACNYYGYSRETMQCMKITDINMRKPEEVREEMARARFERRNYFNFIHRLADGSMREVEVYSGPVIVKGKTLLCSTIHDISERKASEKEREELIEKLQKALSEVKTLRGFLPICASCKKIRDDQGYWNQIESYIKKHSEAQFSHGMCPDCLKKFYPDLKVSRQLKKQPSSKRK